MSISTTLNNPFNIKIQDIVITKFDGTNPLNLMSQFVEISIYQSLYKPLIKAEMLVNDAIGLFTNYPLTGEEIITINYEQSDILKREPTVTDYANADDSDKSLNKLFRKDRVLKFVISGVRNIIPSDNARSVMFILDLESVEAYENAKLRVSHGFRDTIENMAEQIYQQYVVTNLSKRTRQFGLKLPIKTFKKEPGILTRNLVIPNIRPFQAMSWLTKFGIPDVNGDKYTYVFYEDFNGFNFVTLQKLIEDQRNNLVELKSRGYFYSSNFENKNAISSDDTIAARLISNLVINNRYSTLEKIAGGYIENELFEINPLQKSYRSTKTFVDETTGSGTRMYNWNMNTPTYIEYSKSQYNIKENTSRVRYVINDYSDTEQPKIRLKFGETTRHLIALNQIDLHITIPGDLQHNVGELIYVDIPELHGFNNIQSDRYLSGLFIITEAKHVVSAGGMTATTLRINKDSYSLPLLSQMNYSPQ